MAMTLKQWIDDVNLEFINVDNSFGPQCWDLVQHYLTNCLGGGSLATGPSAHQGYAIGAWDGFASNGLAQWFSQAPASATPQPGWVAVWKWGALPFYPLSHIAVVTKNLPAGMVECMTQNPGPAHIQPLAKLGLAGYLVPRANVGGAGTTASTVGFAEDLTDATGKIIGGTGQLIEMGKSVAGIADYFSKPDNWKRIGLFAMGAILLLIVVTILLGKQPIVQTAVKELT